MTESNRHTEWTDRLSDFLDGELERSEHARTEAHLERCGDCRRVLAELREVKERAAELGPLAPSRDLWGGIAATIEAPAVADQPTGARVIELPTAERRDRQVEGTRQPRRFSLTSGQLAAASIALIAMSSLVTWAARSGPAVDGAPTVSSDVPGLTPVARVAEPPADLADELARLERTLLDTRGSLDAHTARVLERNLAIIEQAIADSQRALVQDPENDFLVEHRERMFERKLEYLRDAARVAEQAD